MKQNKSGMTLIEVVIALLIFTVMLGAVFNAFLISAEVNRSSKAFSEARALGQSQLEALYAHQQSSFEDMVYKLEVEDNYVCEAFTYTTDGSGSLIYQITSNPLVCNKIMTDYSIALSFDVQANKLVRTKIIVFSNNPSIKRYETLYAQTFN